MYHTPCKDTEKTSGLITVGIGMRLDINGRIILKWLLRSRIMWCELDSSGSGYRPVASSCEHTVILLNYFEHGNMPLGSRI